MRHKPRPSLKWLAGKSNLVGAEIGVQRAINATEMLKAYDISRLYLVDCYALHHSKVWDCGRKSTMAAMTEGFQIDVLTEALTNLRPFYDRFIMLIGCSWEVGHLIPDSLLDFVYIDGDHSYLGCLEDIRCYYPKVKKGGLVAGHDWAKDGKTGVNDAVKDYFGAEFSKVRVSGADWWYIKPGLDIRRPNST